MRIQELENEGYQFEAADASFDLLVKKIMGTYKPAFELGKYRVTVEQVINQLKNVLGLERLPYWVRGVREVLKRMQNTVFAYICILYCSKLHRRPSREVAPYLV